jgi:hypothetical protein
LGKEILGNFISEINVEQDYFENIEGKEDFQIYPLKVSAQKNDIFM